MQLKLQLGTRVMPRANKLNFVLPDMAALRPCWALHGIGRDVSKKIVVVERPVRSEVLRQARAREPTLRAVAMEDMDALGDELDYTEL